MHSVPEHINTLELELNLPQLTFAQLKQKYSQFWEAGSNYFTGGETQAKKTVDKYWEVKDKQYQQYKREKLLVSIKETTKI